MHPAGWYDHKETEEVASKSSGDPAAPEVASKRGGDPAAPQPPPKKAKPPSHPPPGMASGKAKAPGKGGGKAPGKGGGGGKAAAPGKAAATSEPGVISIHELYLDEALAKAFWHLQHMKAVDCLMRQTR